MGGAMRFRVLIVAVVASLLILTGLLTHQLPDYGDLLIDPDGLFPQMLGNISEMKTNSVSGPVSEQSPGQKRTHIALVSMLYGTNELYERAINTHLQYAERHGYPAYVLREDLYNGVWNKVAYLIHVLISEMEKGEKAARWIMWVDADSAVVNPAIPLDIFLPPEDYPETHLLASKDQNGFNAGMFFLRVHKWSIHLLADALVLRRGNEEVATGFAEQTALYVLFNQTENAPHVLYQPRKWFNTYEFHFAYEGSPGDMFVHFVGLEQDRWDHMSKWLDILEGPEHFAWEKPLRETEYPDKIDEFWRVIRQGRDIVRQVKARFPNTEGLPQTVGESLERLQRVLLGETDQLEAVRNATQELRDAIHNESGFAEAGDRDS